MKVTKTISKCSILIILSILISSCTSDDSSIIIPETDSSLNANITIQESDPLLIEVGYNPENCENLEISCPVGLICDENYIYRAYSFKNSRLYFYISFDPNIIDNISLESLRENFKYVKFIIYFPERETTNSKFLHSNRNPIRQLNQLTDDNLEFTIDSYVNGSIKGVIKGTITEITEVIHSDSPDCFIDDVLGVCTKTEKVNTPFEVKYNFCINN